jgi:MFS family permease
MHLSRLSCLNAWHLTSLDAPTVALAWAFSFAWAAGTHLSLQAAAVIILGVWTVYVGDRLLDARTALRQHTEYRLRERHFFHWRHRRIFVPLAIVAGVAAAVLVLGCIPAIVRERDSILAAASLAYFARVHQSQLSAARRTRPFLPRLVTKESLVGGLFAVGCALPALGAAWARPANTRWTPSLVLIGCVVFFAALAWLNCHAIEQWESEGPQETGAEQRRNLSPARFAFVLASLGLGAAILLSFTHPRPALLLATAAFSALLTALLDILSAQIRTQISPVTLRAAADLVLLVPALVISIAGLVR